MNFPLKASPDSGQIPQEATCLSCGRKIGEIEGFIRLTVGAILHRDHECQTGGPSDMMDTVFSLWYHGPHPVSGRTEDGRAIIGMNNKECDMDIVEPLKGGQVDIHFCSTSCLSTFFSQVVRRFDEEIQHTTKAEPDAPANAG